MSSILASQHQSKSGKAFTIRAALPSDAMGILLHARKVMEEEIYTLSLAEELPATEEQEVEWINKANAHDSSIIEQIRNLKYGPDHYVNTVLMVKFVK